jgi:hypothetical protein
MFSRSLSLALGLVLLLIPLNRLCAEEPPRNPTKASSAQDSLFRIGELAQAAADLRKAGEAFERFAMLLDSLAESIAKSLATMSSEFDPFGYKTAFRTIGRQTEMLQAQRDIIQAFQQREIDRLQSENRELRRELEKLRKRNAKQ